MNIYLAARYSDHPLMRQYRDELEALGHQVTSRWIGGDHDVRNIGIEQNTDLWFAHWASEDWADLLAADCSIHFTEDWTTPRPGRNRGGRHVELGIALALNHFKISSIDNRDWYRPRAHRIIVVGHRENVFHYLPAIEFFPTWDEALTALAPTGVAY